MKEEVTKGFSWDEIEPWSLNIAFSRFDLPTAARELLGMFHLFKPVYDAGVKFVFVSEMSFVIVA
jgi:hypothetical protein